MKAKRYEYLIDLILRPFLIIWQLATKRYAASWHWRINNSAEEIDVVKAQQAAQRPEKFFPKVHHDKTAKSPRNKFDEFIKLNFLWKKVVILTAFTPDDRLTNFYLGRIEADRTPRIYGRLQKRQVAVIRGSVDQEYFALDQEGNFLRLSIDYSAKDCFKQQSLNKVKLI